MIQMVGHPSDRPDRSGTKPRILLLNPPGDEIYIRDYYCSKVSKTTYVYTPVDLLIISARLNGHAELAAIDAIGEGISSEEVLTRIARFAPTAIVCLTAAVSWELDIAFLKKLRQTFKGRILASGDVLMDSPLELLDATPEIDAVVTDFTSTEVVGYCLGEKGPFSDIVMRGEDGKAVGSKPVQGTMVQEAKSYDIPLPRHDLFPQEKYRYPFVRKLPFATVLTDFGCAFKCTFCIQSFLDFKARSAENVIEELRYLKKRGIRDIYFSDQTFAFNPTRARKIFQAMIDEKMGFGWVAFYRVDLVKEEMLALMKKAGCHTLMFGIENASEALLKEYKKNIKLDTIRSALALCRMRGIRTVGTFILGFPNETRADIEATIAFSLELPLDYASYNLPVPRSKTDLRKQAIEGQIVQKDKLVMDQSGKYVTMGNKHLSGQELFALRNHAIRAFYLRPAYLFRRIFSIRTWDEFMINVLDGFTLLRESFRKPKNFTNDSR